jgi:6,7-dimethyl-8-ribityllumazine synthase
MHRIDGPLDAAGLRIAVVVSAFNSFVTDGLLAGALAALEGAGAADVTVVRVPGSFELPLVASALAGQGYHGVVALGAVIEGETDHYEHVATQTAAGLARVALDTGVPVGFGVLTTRSAAQARERSLPGAGNKGAEAAGAVVRTARILQQLETQPAIPS